MKENKTIIEKVSDKVGKAISWINAVILVFMVLMVFVSIVTRLLGVNLEGISESCEILVVYVAFLGIAYGFHTNSHLRMPLLVQKFPKGFQKVWTVAIYLLALAYFILLTYCSFKFFWASFLTQAKANPMLPLRIWWGRVAVPVGCGLTVVQLVIEIILLVYREFFASRRDTDKGGNAQ